MSEFGPSPEPHFREQEPAPELEITPREAELLDAVTREAPPWRQEDLAGPVEYPEAVPEWHGDRSVEQAAREAAITDARARVEKAFEAKETPEPQKLGTAPDQTQQGSHRIDYGDEAAVEQAREKGRKTIARFAENYLIDGEPAARVDDWHPQGWNDHGFRGTCAIAAVQEAAREQGIDTSEQELVDIAVDRGLCDSGMDDPADNGATQLWQLQELISTFGLESEVRDDQGIEDIAAALDRGDSVLLLADGERTFDGGRAYLHSLEEGHPLERPADGSKHFVHATGVIRDLQTEAIKGIFINDPGDRPGRPMTNNAVRRAWEGDTGTMLLVRRP